MKSFLCLGGAIVALTGVLAGCAESNRAMKTTRTTHYSSTGERTVVASEREARAAEGEAPMSAEEQRSRVTIIVEKEPPLTMAELPSHEPREGEFWVAGYWVWDGNDYKWQPGRIERDRLGLLFVPANWVKTERGFEFTPEYWR